MSRIDVFNAISAALQARQQRVKHVELWNHNVEYLEEEAPFDMPAVFVEFGPINWKPMKDASVGGCELRLHIVGHQPDTSSEAMVLLADAVAALVTELPFVRCRVQSLTNHNHDEIVEHIETFNIIL